MKMGRPKKLRNPDGSVVGAGAPSWPQANAKAPPAAPPSFLHQSMLSKLAAVSAGEWPRASGERPAVGGMVPGGAPGQSPGGPAAGAKNPLACLAQTIVRVPCAKVFRVCEVLRARALTQAHLPAVVFLAPGGMRSEKRIRAMCVSL